MTLAVLKTSEIIPKEKNGFFSLTENPITKAYIAYALTQSGYMDPVFENHGQSFSPGFWDGSFEERFRVGMLAYVKSVGKEWGYSDAVPVWVFDGILEDIFFTHEHPTPITAFMQKNNMFFSRAVGSYNIIYIRDCLAEGHRLSYRKGVLNEWSDVRLILDHKGNIVHVAAATVSPGLKYTILPLNPKGAARLADGQYRAWVDGYHKRNYKHPALVQALGLPISRDEDRDGVIDPNEKFVYLPPIGINQHSTAAAFKSKYIDKWSAGCLVGQKMEDHFEFLALLRRDYRNLETKGQYIFITKILNGKNYFDYVNAASTKNDNPTR